jgi:hypothetical protein
MSNRKSKTKAAYCYLMSHNTKLGRTAVVIDGKPVLVCNACGEVVK